MNRGTKNQTLDTLLGMFTVAAMGAGLALGITSDEPLTPYSILKLSATAVGHGAMATSIIYGLKIGMSGLYYLSRKTLFR